MSGSLHPRSFWDRDYSSLASMIERVRSLLDTDGLSSAKKRDAMILLSRARKLALLETHMLMVQDNRLDESISPVLSETRGSSLVSDAIMFQAESLPIEGLLGVMDSMSSVNRHAFANGATAMDSDASSRDRLTNVRNHPGYQRYLAEANRLSHHIKELRLRAQLLIEESGRGANNG